MLPWPVLAVAVESGVGRPASVPALRSPVRLALASVAGASQPKTSKPAGPSTQPASSLSRDEELDELVGLITGNNTPEARELGARSLLRRGTEVAAQRLADILTNSKDLAAKQAICRAIAAFGAFKRSTARSQASGTGASTTQADPGLPADILVGPLLGMLGDHGRELDEAIVLALRRFDSSVVIPQLEVLAGGAAENGADPTAVDAGGGRPSESLVKQEAAIRALGFMGDELQAVGVLVGLLEEPSSAGEQGPSAFSRGVRIRAAVLDAIAQATGVQHRNIASARAWWESHRTMGPLEWLQDVNARRIDQINHLSAEKELLTQRLVGAYREAYLQTAEAQRPKKLLAFLSDESTAVRRLGLDLINAMITDRKDVGPEIKARLVEMINEGDAEVRKEVAVMVGDLRLAGAVGRLVESLAAEEDYDVRAAQVAALGRLDDESSIPLLIASLDDEAPEVVKEAALALGTLARKGHADPKVVDTVVAALLKRFARIPETLRTATTAAGGGRATAAKRPDSTVDAEDLRERFLEAMGHIGDERFREVFRRELDPRHSVRTRRAAIAGMGPYADAAAAAEIRKYVSAAEPEIRLAAVQALGRCGRQAEDLDALIRHLDSSQESNAVVRDRAWSSYRAVVHRLSPQAQLEAAARFARSGDLPAQRRRLILLRELETDEQRYAALSADERLSLLEAVVDAQFELGQYDAVAKYLEKFLFSGRPAPTTSAPAAGHRFLVLRLLAALLKAGRDQDAVDRLQESAGRTVVDGSGPRTALNLDGSDIVAAARVFLDEAKSRLAAADDASQFSALFGLVALASPVVSDIAPSVGQELAAVKREAVAQRDAVVSRLLNAALASSEAEPQLLAFGSEIVLPEIVSRLRALSAGTDAVVDIEMRLVGLARKLVPAWQGYTPGCPESERAAALAALGRHLPGAEAQSETMPSSAPGRPRS